MKIDFLPTEIVFFYFWYFAYERVLIFSFIIFCEIKKKTRKFKKASRDRFEG